MHSLNIRFTTSVPPKFIAILTTNFEEEVEVNSDLPFFVDQQEWRTTILKLLESSDLPPESFLSEDEQLWLSSFNFLCNKRFILSQSDRLAMLGQVIFKSIFRADPKAYSLLRQSMNRAKEARTYLNIRLMFRADIVQVSRIPDYPWEIMHDGERFLAHNNVVFSRHISRPETPPRFDKLELIRILRISSSASDISNNLLKLSAKEKNLLILHWRKPC
jgi:hypothetical protein